MNKFVYLFFFLFCFLFFAEISDYFYDVKIEEKERENA